MCVNAASIELTLQIVYVVDSGRVKETSFDPDLAVQRLVETWISHASARQRRGRAGRVRPGEAYKLYSRSWTARCVMADQTKPEMLRTPLERLALTVKSTHPEADIASYIAQALSPPDVRSVAAAVQVLRDIGALDDGQDAAARLTSLGNHLALLPVDIRLGKVRSFCATTLTAQILVLATVFRCLDPILTVVACLSSKPLFLSPPDDRDASRQARESFSTSASDLLTDAAAWAAADEARQAGHAALRDFCEANFVSASAVRDIGSLRIEYIAALAAVGFVSQRADPVEPSLNANAGNAGLLAAIIFAGTGRVIQVRLPDARFIAVSSALWFA